MENGVTEGQGHTTMLSGGRFSGGIQKKRGADRTRTGTGQLGRKVNMKAKFIVAAQSKCTKRERRERERATFAALEFCAEIHFRFVLCVAKFFCGKGERGYWCGVLQFWVGGKFMFMMCVPERCFWYASLR